MVSTAERKRRETALREAMHASGYQALLLAGNAEAAQRGYIRYLSDWRLWGGSGYLVFPLDGDPVLVLGSCSQAHWAKGVGWIRDVRCALVDKIAEVVRVLRTKGLSRSSIGVVGLNRLMPYGDAKALMALLPEAHVQDATRLVDDVMAVKSQEEIAQAAETCRFVAQALERVKEVLSPGKTEREVMAEAIRFLAARGCLDGIAHISAEAAPYVSPARDRRIEVDDILKVSLEFAGPGGYWVELSAVFSFREPPDRERRLFATALKALERGRDLMRPGVKGGELSRAIEETYREDGWHITGRSSVDIHGIGLNVIAPPIGLPGSDDELRENMILNIHPGILVDDEQWGI
ncbi:MAG: M24 family metallopeptidase, partial [Anaerolineae bacterium]